MDFSTGPKVEFVTNEKIGPPSHERYDLTVAILCRNRPIYLHQMLESIANATSRKIRVVVRDHSDDNRCAQVVEEISEAASSLEVVHIHPRPRGQRENVLGAVRECETEFVMIVHDDDLCVSGFIDLLLEPLIDNPSLGFATGNVVCVDKLGRELPRLRHLLFTESGCNPLETVSDRAEFHVVRRLLQPFYGTIFRSHFLRDLYLPPEASTLPDLWVARHMVDQEVAGWCTDEVVFRYRVHRESIAGEGMDLDGYRWSMNQFLADEVFATFRDELRDTLRDYERTTFLGRFAGGERTKHITQEIVSRTAPPSAARRAAVRIALHPPFSALTCRYLKLVNPRLSEKD